MLKGEESADQGRVLAERMAEHIALLAGSLAGESPAGGSLPNYPRSDYSASKLINAPCLYQLEEDCGVSAGEVGESEGSAAEGRVVLADGRKSHR